MLPREHGAYGQLMVPLVTALAIGRLRPVAVALASAAVCAFLAHEPLQVLMGARGSRAARDRRVQAWRWVSAWGAAAAGVGVVAVVLAAAQVRVALVVPVIFAVGVSVAIVRRREHTLAGEILSALTFGSFAAPVAVAARVPQAVALTCAAVYALGFVSATVSVHAVILRSRQPPALAARAAAVGVAAGSAVALMGLASYGTLVAAAPWAALPLCALSCGLAIRPPPARQLRVIGWMLVAASLTTALILVSAHR